MTRQLDAASLAALKAREGCELAAYQDQGGVWTIGYGHTGSDVVVGLVITQAQADNLLLQDVAWAEAVVEAAVLVDLNDAQFGALVSFVYNVGASNFKTSTLLKKLNAGNYDAVPGELLKWVNVDGARDQGLVNRRNSEGGQWVKGAYVRGAAITPDKPVNRVLQKLVGAAVAGGSMMTAESVKTAADAAQNAASLWHGFTWVAGILTGVFVFWAIFEAKKS